MNRQRLALLFASVFVVACGGDSGGDDHDHDHPDAGPGSTDADTTPAPSPATMWMFGADGDANRWTVTIVDAHDSQVVIKEFDVSDLADLSGPVESGGNGAGPSWGDAVTSTDHKRIFVNARSVNKVAVFDVESQTLETVIDVGERPVHSFNPNHGSEIWVHADGPGAFYVIDQTSLAVSEPITAALNDTGHGKLLYAQGLGTEYFATNTNDPGIFPINGAAHSVGGIINVCDLPCEDDPATPEDESLLTCGSTHDKAYNPTTNFVIAQCSGAARGHYGFVNAETHEVVHDMVPMSGSVAHSANWEYILVIDGDDVNIWDTGAADHDGVAFDAQVTVSGRPSARGTHFWKNDAGDWEAWIPQTEGTGVDVVNMRTREFVTVDIGTLTEPEGASHFSRRSSIGAGFFVSYNDAGVVLVDLATRTMTQGPATQALTARVAFADPEAHE